MHTDTPPPFTLLECAYRHLTRELCRALPPTPTETERDDRDKAAIAQVSPPPRQHRRIPTRRHVRRGVSACPAQPRPADEPGIPPAPAVRWTSKADQMMRQANSAMRSLLRLQAIRGKLEADPKAYDRGERIEHTMTVLMTGAIGHQPPISSDDPESWNHATEILPRQPTPIPPAIPSPEHAAIRTQSHLTIRNPHTGN